MNNRLIGFLTLITLPFASLACDSPYSNKTLTRAQVKSIVKENPQANLCKAILNNINLSQLNLHGVNFEQASLNMAKLNGSDLSRANLKGADLSQSQLDKTYFRWANLNNASLQSANLKQTVFLDASMQGADLSRSKLLKTNFTNANLNLSDFTLTSGSNVIFDNAHLTKSNFSLSQITSSDFSRVSAEEANFSEAKLILSDFTDANLTKAQFIESNLTGVLLKETTLTNTNFQQANFKNVIYMPRLHGFPELGMLATAKNFETIQFYDESIGAPALSGLQVAYKMAGMRSMERLITSMIKEQQMRHNLASGGLATIEGMFSYVFFYLPSHFGLYPGKALSLFVLMMLILTIPYYLSLGAHSPHSGIIVSWPSRRDSTFMLEASYQHFVKIHEHDPFIVKCIKRYQRLLSALYFSLLSSFQIGWQDFNVARWIALMQTKEYQYIARGWVRTLAGMQSIISAYLILLWALTYFGRPFDW